MKDDVDLQVKHALMEAVEMATALNCFHIVEPMINTKAVLANTFADHKEPGSFTTLVHHMVNSGYGTGSGMHHPTAETFRDVMEKGAKSAINTRNHRNESPLLYTHLYGNRDYIPLLVKYGADTSLEGLSGHTPLHLHAARGEVEEARKLLADPANHWMVHALNDHGKWPLHLLFENESGNWPCEHSIARKEGDTTHVTFTDEGVKKIYSDFSTLLLEHGAAYHPQRGGWKSTPEAYRRVAQHAYPTFFAPEYWRRHGKSALELRDDILNTKFDAYQGPTISTIRDNLESLRKMETIPLEREIYEKPSGAARFLKPKGSEPGAPGGRL